MNGGGRLAGRVALVTGGTRGIGESIVRLFAAEGASVVFCGRRRADGERLAAELSARGQVGTYLELDVSREEDANAVVRDTLDRYGRLDVLVNNAGITASGNV